METVLDENVEKSKSGLDRDKINTLKTDIVAYETRINNIFNDIDIAVSDIDLSIGGEGKREFDSEFNKIKASNNNIIKNIDLHIDELNSAITLFENQDIALSESVSTDVVA